MTPFTEETAQETEHEQFHIDTDSAAEWLLRKLGNIEAEQRRVQAQAAEILRQLDADAQHLRGLYEGELLDYCRLKLAQNGSRRRSLTFLQGTVAFRSVPASIRVFDAFRALDHCQQAAPGLVKTTVQVDREAFQRMAAKHFQETGELLPGVETTPAHETHRVTFGK